MDGRDALERRRAIVENEKQLAIAPLATRSSRTDLSNIGYAKKWKLPWSSTKEKGPEKSFVKKSKELLGRGP